MKKIQILLSLILLLVTAQLKAQDTDTLALINAYYASDFIFEGVVESKCYYDDPTTGNIYTSNTIYITKIFKGNVNCGTVNIITPGGELNGYELHVSHQTEFNVGVSGVFMCKTTDYPQPSCNVATNELGVELTVAFQGTLEYLFDNINNEVEGFNSYFNTLDEFYAFLSLNGINAINCDNTVIKELRKRSNLKDVVVEPILERAASKNEISDVILQSKMANLSKEKNILKKAPLSIEPFISNLTFITIGTNKYYDIELSVKSNVDTVYLDLLTIRLNYNKAAFGTNVSSVSTFTQGSYFGSNVYDYVQLSDFNDSTLNFLFTTTQAIPARKLLSISGNIIGTVRIVVNNCKQLAKLNVSAQSSLGLTYYSKAQTSVSLFPFDSYITGSSQQGSVCLPKITSLSSNSLSAGIGDVLTIDGDNFGTTKGNVSMRNADGTPSTIALDKYDITQWTNSQIKIKIPSSVDSADFNGTTYTKHPVGTGPITITDALSGSVTSTPVTVKYAVANGTKVYSTGYAKTNRFLFSNNSDGLYHFKLNANITNPKMIDCIKAAIRRWRCTTGVPFVLDPGSVSTGTASDGFNIISLASLGSSTNAQTFSRSVAACSTTPTVPFSAVEMDIEINNNRPEFKFDTTGTLNIDVDSIDFFRTIMHELGHAMGLQHSLNNDMIMYYAATIGAVIPAINRTIVIKNNDLTAGNYIVNNSVSTPSGMTCSYNLPITKQTAYCAWNNAVNEFNNVGQSLYVYPNPFSSTISIEFRKVKRSNVQISIYDITGKKVYDNNSYEAVIGNNRITLAELNFNDGLYLLNLMIDGESHTYRILCEH